MGLRRKARELVLQALFQAEFLKKPAQEQFHLLVDNFKLNQKVLPHAQELLTGVCERLTEIDAAINKSSTNWKLSRMSAVDRNIIRIATNEMLFCQDIPDTVSINEAIEIAKKYSTADAGPFINGVLDAIRQSRSKRNG